MADNDFEESEITLTDEEGKECKFEVLGTFELDDTQYMALIPVDSDDDECVLLKLTTDENGETMLVTIDDDEEFQRAADAFENEYMGECDLDDDGEDEYDDEEEEKGEDEQ